VSESDVADPASSTCDDPDDSPVQLTTTQTTVDITDDTFIKGESSDKEAIKILDDLEDIPVQKVEVTTEDIPARHESLIPDDPAQTIATADDLEDTSTVKATTTSTSADSLIKNESKATPAIRSETKTGRKGKPFGSPIKKMGFGNIKHELVTK
jgi:hypothetical protein